MLHHDSLCGSGKYTECDYRIEGCCACDPQNMVTTGLGRKQVLYMCQCDCPWNTTPVAQQGTPVLMVGKYHCWTLFSLLDIAVQGFHSRGGRGGGGADTLGGTYNSVKNVEYKCEMGLVQSANLQLPGNSSHKIQRSEFWNRNCIFQLLQGVRLYPGPK